MTYNFHGTWDRMTGHHSPLYARQDESNFQQTLNMDWVVKYWNKKGAPKHKLLLGMATYGRSFTLRDTTKYEIGAPITGDGKSQYLKNGGLMPYFEICSNLKFHDWNEEWNDEHKVPYAFKDDQWSNYIVNEGLGGALVWAIDFDDFNNWCGDGPFPLITKIKDVFSSPRVSLDLPNKLP
ncbi:hypothetical protein KUTeg_004460 [Tegillarca granosa]|uniref:GH18 domain-containing protein n=1 Tax=Tegillarca granosa TaxID=220873 RepID=A0ABQ9FQ06_TEGGR|nr:hypothetical protein KUTeg_004460 [Tegillarca granosa]